MIVDGLELQIFVKTFAWFRDFGWQQLAKLKLMKRNDDDDDDDDDNE